MILDTFQSEEDKAPVSQLLNDVMNYVKNSSGEQDQNQDVLEQLQLAVFKLVSLSADSIDDVNDVITTGRKRADALESHVNCSLKATNWQLGHCSRSFLLKIFASGGSAIRMTSIELDVWLQALKIHPAATAFFVDTCRQVLADPTAHQDRLPACSPLMAAAWTSFTSGAEDIAAYIRAVTTALLLTRFENHPEFASAVAASAPEELLNDSLRSILRMWTGDKKKSTMVTSSLGVNRFTEILLDSIHVEDVDWVRMKAEWDAELLRCKDRPDELESTLYRSLTCLTSAEDRRANRMLPLLAAIFDVEDVSVRNQLSRKLLEHPMALGSFDPIGVKGGDFSLGFTSLIRDRLRHLKLDAYKEKLVDAVVHGVASAQQKLKKVSSI